MEDAAAQSARAAINAAISARFGDDGVESAIDIVHAVGLCAVRVQTRADAVIEVCARPPILPRSELARRIEHSAQRIMVDSDNAPQRQNTKDARRDGAMRASRRQS